MEKCQIVPFKVIILPTKSCRFCCFAGATGWSEYFNCRRRPSAAARSGVVAWRARLNSGIKLLRPHASLPKPRVSRSRARMSAICARPIKRDLLNNQRQGPQPCCDRRLSSPLYRTVFFGANLMNEPIKNGGEGQCGQQSSHQAGGDVPAWAGRMGGKFAHSTPDPDADPSPPRPLPDDVPPPAHAPVQEPTLPEPPIKALSELAL